MTQTLSDYAAALGAEHALSYRDGYSAGLRDAQECNVPDTSAPDTPLAGIWGDEPVMNDILALLGNHPSQGGNFDPDDDDNVAYYGEELNRYEQGFCDAYAAEYMNGYRSGIED